MSETYLVAECKGYDERGNLVHLHVQPLDEPRRDPAGDLARVEWGELLVTDGPLPRTRRWAAFTDEELARLDDCIFIAGQAERERTGEHLGQTTQDMHIEVLAEIERRRSPS